VQVKHDRDAFKEIWLLFENDQGRFPLYPGDTTWIEYSYSVSEAKWGHWFQRAIRVPTERLGVEIALPTRLDPALWGIETTMTAEAMPVRTPIHRRELGDEVVFEWSTWRTRRCTRDTDSSGASAPMSARGRSPRSRASACGGSA
jgi:hypothetical protein